MDTPVKQLICTCCRETAYGRQWHNQEQGYGLCAACIPRAVHAYGRQCNGKEELISCYGHRGIHYGTPEGEYMRIEDTRKWKIFLRELHEFDIEGNKRRALEHEKRKK